MNLTFNHSAYDVGQAMGLPFIKAMEIKSDIESLLNIRTHTIKSSQAIEILTSKYPDPSEMIYAMFLAGYLKGVKDGEIMIPLPNIVNAN